MRDEIEVAENRLTLHRDLGTKDIAAFRRVSREFLEAGHKDLVIDLSPLSIVSSTTVGMIVATHLRAAERGLHLTIRVGEKALSLFELMRLTDHLSIEVVTADE